jgi:aldehyde dehydrogenase (NAD+)
MYEALSLLNKLDVDIKKFEGTDIIVNSPIDGSHIASIRNHSRTEYDAMIKNGQDSFLSWRQIPAPLRGELVRLYGEVLREYKQELGRLVTWECGKILSEGLGEVQEMIDICDFAVGLSRQLYGLTIVSERPEHHMREVWHPLGIVGVISAFNFPVAVWCWNSALALVCGNTLLWKPSEKTPLTALACQALFECAVLKFKKTCPQCPEYLSQILIGEREAGEWLSSDTNIPLVSATGSTRMGRAVATTVAERLGRSLLELGGNNAMIVTPSADIDMAVRATLFGAVGTAGQRCTTLRRLIVHESIKDNLIQKLIKAYQSLRIGSPLVDGILVGCLIDETAFNGMQDALKHIVKEGGNILTGGTRVSVSECPNGFYVSPALVAVQSQTPQVKHEVFAPILYVMSYTTLDEAIALQNDVPQGLSSSIFSTDMRETERFLSATGSDCGIANVNIGTSGAEIGGAFGGEKETGGGRESGSDSWKAYMRRQTQTINYSSNLPLAQGVVFDV